MKEGVAGQGAVPQPAGAADRVAVEVDPRLADVWAFLYSAALEPGQVAENVGTFMRMAYLQGYRDALFEQERGELLRRLGVRMALPAGGRCERRRRDR